MIENATIIYLFFIQILEAVPIFFLNCLKCYLSTLGIDFSKIGLTENWGKQHNIDLRNLSGYKHNFFIRLNRRGGGVSLYVKNCLPHTQRIDLANNDNIFESIFIEIEKKIFDTNKHIIIRLIYKPPSTSVKQFNEKFELKKNAYLYGDFNICSKNELTETDLQNQNFYQLLLSYYYQKLITVPTRVDERTKTSSLIDNIYTNILESDTDMTGVLKTHISDHYSIFHAHKNSNRIID